MADKAQLKCNQGDIYPLCSLDNMVRSVSSSEAVSIPVLDAAGKIPTSYFPDGIGSGAETETDITSLGSASVVVVAPGSSYVWDVTGNQTISAVGSSGYIGSSSFIRINMKAGAITGAGVTIETPLSANTNNYCNVEFRGGEVYLSSFYSWNDRLIVSNSTYNLINNTVDNALVLYAGIFNISSGGTANSTTVSSGGTMTIYSGGRANSTLASAGNLIVSNGGIANSTTISLCYLTVSSGGVANGINLASRGYLQVKSGGIASNISATNSSYIYVSSGGIVASIAIISLAGLSVSRGGTASNIRIAVYASMTVYIGGYANNTTVNSGGTLTVSSGGTANSITVNSGGHLTASGSVTNIKENGGYAYTIGIIPTFIPNTFSHLVFAASGTTATVHSGTTAINNTVKTKGQILVYSGGIANNTKVSSGGTLTVSGTSGIANSTIVYLRGSMFVKPRAITNSTTVSSGGTMVVSSGGLASNVVSNTGAVITVLTGGTIHYAP